MSNPLCPDSPTRLGHIRATRFLGGRWFQTRTKPCSWPVGTIIEDHDDDGDFEEVTLVEAPIFLSSLFSETI